MKTKEFYVNKVMILLLSCLLLVSKNSLSVSSLPVNDSHTTHWLISCDNECKEALQFAIDKKCNSQKQCFDLVSSFNSDCIDCPNRIVDSKHMEIVESQYFLCDKESQVQVIACQYYCRVNFFSGGECQRDSYINKRICKCFNSNEIEYGDTTSMPKVASLISDSAAVSNIYYEERFKLDGSISGTNALAALSNGYLGGGNRENTIEFWNTDDGTLKQTINAHNGSVCALATLKNGDLVSASSDTIIKIWDIETGELKLTISGHTGAINALAVLPNGNLASASDDHTIRFWNTQDGTLKQTLSTNNSKVYALAVLPNGDLASGLSDRTIKIWNTEDGIVKQILKINHIFGILFGAPIKVLPNGELASEGQGFSVDVWNTETGTVKRTLSPHSFFDLVSIKLKNGDLASPEFDETIKIWKKITL